MSARAPYRSPGSTSEHPRPITGVSDALAGPCTHAPAARKRHAQPLHLRRRRRGRRGARTRLRLADRRHARLPRGGPQRLRSPGGAADLQRAPAHGRRRRDRPARISPHRRRWLPRAVRRGPALDPDPAPGSAPARRPAGSARAPRGPGRPHPLLRRRLRGSAAHGRAGRGRRSHPPRCAPGQAAGRRGPRPLRRVRHRRGPARQPPQRRRRAARHDRDRDRGRRDDPLDPDADRAGLVPAPLRHRTGAARRRGRRPAGPGRARRPRPAGRGGRGRAPGRGVQRDGRDAEPARARGRGLARPARGHPAPRVGDRVGQGPRGPLPARQPQLGARVRSHGGRGDRRHGRRHPPAGGRRDRPRERRRGHARSTT
jgi:hypothetical protein